MVLYIKDFLANPDNGEAAKRHAVCEVKQLAEFFKEKQAVYYSKLQRETIMEYPNWRNGNRKDGRDRRISTWTCN
ncbi:MAG: hypothetical protein FWH22_03480 [Fibromonadales bacterium]|nr:hypothetical protein [Fibromonadales bacterium]